MSVCTYVGLSVGPSVWYHRINATRVASFERCESRRSPSSLGAPVGTLRSDGTRDNDHSECQIQVRTVGGRFVSARSLNDHETEKPTVDGG